MADEQQPGSVGPLGADLPELPSLEEHSGIQSPGLSGSGELPSASLAAGLAPNTLGFDARAIARKLGRGLAWFFGLLIIFIVSAWISLPTRSIAWRISHEARKAGFNITIEDISVYPWGSATLEEVSWNFKPSRADSNPIPFIVDELDVSFSVLKYLLFDEIDAEFEGKLDEGTITGAFVRNEDESHVAFTIADLPLYGVPKLQEAVNAPVRGIFALDIDITAPGNEWAKSDGKLEIHCYSCTIGDSDTKLFVPGSKKGGMLAKGVKIPEIDLGTLDGLIMIEDGLAVAEEFGTESEDIVFKISGEIEFKDPVATTRLDLTVKIFITPSLRERSESVDLLVLTASDKVKMDPPDEGWMAVVLEGNLKHRRFRGIKQLTRQERLRSKREARSNRARERAMERAEARETMKANREEAAAAGVPEEEGGDEAAGADEGEPTTIEEPEVGEAAAGDESTEEPSEEGGDEAGGEEEVAAGEDEEIEVVEEDDGSAVGEDDGSVAGEDDGSAAGEDDGAAGEEEVEGEEMPAIR